MRINRDEDEELLYAIQNMAHAEYHLLELYEKNLSKGFILEEEITTIKSIRRALMARLEELYGGTSTVWCTVKHLLLSHFHLLELFEHGYIKSYMIMANDVYTTIFSLIKKDYTGFTNCGRCDSDKGGNNGDI